MPKGWGRTLLVVTVTIAVLLCAHRASSQELPSETPATLIPVTDGFDYVRRDVMIPMRDG